MLIPVLGKTTSKVETWLTVNSGFPSPINSLGEYDNSFFWVSLGYSENPREKVYDPTAIFSRKRWWQNIFVPDGVYSGVMHPD